MMSGQPMGGYEAGTPQAYAAQANQAQEAAALELMLSNLQRRDQDAEQKREQQERQWRQERESIERGHRQTVTALEHEKEDLRREQAELQLRTVELESDIQRQRAERDVMQQEHSLAQEEATKKQAALRRQRVLDRFRMASDKTRTQSQKQEVSKELLELREKYVLLQANLVARDRELAQRPPKFRGMYIGQTVNKDSGATTCDMCYEADAVRRCHDCGGDYLCELCDLNQHRSIQTRGHQRSALLTGSVEGVILCEFCGMRRAAITCPECINGRLCQDCDDIKHRSRRRNFHHRTPGVAIAVGPDQLGSRLAIPARTLIDEDYFPRYPAVPPRESHTIATPTYPHTQYPRLEAGTRAGPAAPYAPAPYNPYGPSLRGRQGAYPNSGGYQQPYPAYPIS
jgi:hypothetical protein